MGKVLDALSEVDVSMLWQAVEGAATRLGLGVYITRIEPQPYRILYVSELTARLAGRPAAELVGGATLASVRASDRPAVQAVMDRTDERPTEPMELALLRPDGVEVPVEVTAMRIPTSSGLVAIGYLRDVSGERAAIAALHESERRFQSLVEAAPDGIVISVAGRIVFSNPRGARLLADATPADVDGRMIGSFLPPADAALAGARIGEMMRTGGEMAPNEYGVLVDPARVVEIKSIRIAWEGRPAVLAFARDVTERKALQISLARADRLTGLGTLAAGVAHEINNPLAYAQLSVQRLGRLQLPETAQRALADIDHALARIATITEGLRTFARPVEDAPPGPVDLATVVDQALRMVDHDVRHRARLVRSIEPDLPPVRGHDARLEQVLVNLLVNAVQSLDAVADGVIELSVKRTAQDRVTLAIRDNGRGIPDDIRERVFDPFFTTKPVGEGLGLGLAVVKSIVEGTGGAIELASRPGAGTTVTLTLRVHAGAPTGKLAKVGAAVRTGLRILIVDDEAPLRTILAELLGDDHEVATAASATEALELFADGQRAFDAVVCDLMMPGLDGRELYRRIAELRPGLAQRVVFITGGILEREREQFVAQTGNPCLLKPFDVNDLLAALARVTAG